MLSVGFMKWLTMPVLQRVDGAAEMSQGNQISPVKII